MNWAKLLGFGAAALIGVFVLSIIVDIVFGVIGFALSVVGFLWSVLWTLISIGVPLAIAAGVAYGAYKLYSMASDDSSTVQAADSQWEAGEEKQKSPQERYAEGDISEGELERQLEYEIE